MNCKPGDLAVIVRSQTGAQLGKIVRCISVATGIVQYRGANYRIPSDDGVWWELEEPIQLTVGNNQVVSVPFCQDASLRPIRGEEGEDETLAWAGKPLKEKTC